MKNGQLMAKEFNCELRFEAIGNGYAIWHMYSDITGHHCVIDAITTEQVDACITDKGYDTRLLPLSKRVHEHWKGFLINQSKN